MASSSSTPAAAAKGDEAAAAATATASASASAPVPPSAEEPAPPPPDHDDGGARKDGQGEEEDDDRAAAGAAGAGPAADPPKVNAAADADAPLTQDEQAALDSAERLKAEGNALYARQEHAAALDKYLEAADLAALPPHRPPPAHAPVAAAAASLRAACFANGAACACAQKDWPRAAELATLALELRPDYLKALMRRSAAREALDDPEGALADARTVGELAAGGAAAAAGAAAATEAAVAAAAGAPLPAPAAIDRAALQWARAAASRLGPLALERQERMKAEVLGKLKDLGNSILGRFGVSLDDFCAEKDPATGSYSIKFGQQQKGGVGEDGGGEAS